MTEMKLRISNSGYIDKGREMRIEKKSKGVPAMPRLQYKDGKLVTDSKESAKLQTNVMLEEERLKQDAILFNKRDRIYTISMPKV